MRSELTIVSFHHMIKVDLANRKIDDGELLLTYWGPRSRTKNWNFDYGMEIQTEKQVVFIEMSDEKNSGMAIIHQRQEQSSGC